MADVRLHGDVVEAFCAGRLDRAEEAALAEQVAQVYVWEPILPNATVIMMGRLTRHLGGQAEILRWLSAFPGKPRLVAAVVGINDILGALSGDQAIVDGVRELRTQPRYQRALAAYWAPSTDHTTLSDLAESAKHMLREDRFSSAVHLSTLVLDFLEEALPLAERRGADVHMVHRWLSDARDRLEAAAVDIGHLLAPAQRDAAADGQAAASRRRVLPTRR
jgi:hypothetical protein